MLKGLDERVERLNAAKTHSAKPSKGWLRAIREAIGQTQGNVAENISVKRQTYAQFEVAEERESISLSSLRRAAEGMGCELVYFVVPKGSTPRTFGDLSQSLDPHARHAEATDHSMLLKSDIPPQ
jgi:predicted DNA-binding mobile mystery protein A